MKTQKIKTMKKEKIFYALVCEETGVNGAFVSREQAREYNQEISLCPARHKILKCQIKLLKK